MLSGVRGLSRARLLAGLVRWSVRRPGTVLALAALLVAVSLLFAFLHLELKTSNLDLVDPEAPTVRRFLDFARDFGNPNVLVVVVEGPDPATVGAAVDQLGPRLREGAEVRTVFDRLPHDPDALRLLGTNPYLTSADGHLAAILVWPRDDTSSAEAMAPFVATVRGVLADTPLPEAVRTGVTGIPAYALDDRDVIQRDVARLSTVGAGLVLMLFAAAFGRLRRPLLALAALGAAVASTLGAAALFPGHLTLLSAFFGSILFGLGIDFAVHLIDRTEELGGLPLAEALPLAAGGLAAPLVTGAVTSASAFFAMSFAGFRGFQELGFVAGVGLLLAGFATLTVLPALLVTFADRPARERPSRERPGRGPKSRSQGRIGGLLVALQSPLAAATLGLAAVALGLFAWSSGKPSFDTDYLALQPADSETVYWERQLVARSPWSPQFAVFTVESREELLDLLWRLADEETVGAVRSLRNFELPGLPGALPELPAGLVGRFRAEDGRLAVYAYPVGDVWSRPVQDAFLARMRSVDPEVTGMPFLGRFMLDRSRHALWVTGALGVALLAFWVSLDFRRPNWAALAMAPALLTLPATCGVMALLGMELHPLNVMALPVILGIAVDDGIHIVHRFRAEHGHLDTVLRGTGRSVVLTSLTNLAAFGCLVFTAHRGLSSFAAVLCLGVSLALVLSTLVLPQTLALVARRKTVRGTPPYAGAELPSRDSAGI